MMTSRASQEYESSGFPQRLSSFKRNLKDYPSWFTFFSKRGIESFHVVVLQRTAKKCTNNYKARAQQFLACTWRHHFLKSKLKDPLMFLSSLDMRGGNYICVPLFSWVACFLWKPAQFKFQSYDGCDGAWHKAAKAFVKKSYSYLVIFSHFRT